MYPMTMMNEYVNELRTTLGGIVTQNENLLQIAATTGAPWREPNEQQCMQLVRRAPAARVVLSHAPFLILMPFFPPAQVVMWYWTRILRNGIVHTERDAMHRSHTLPKAWKETHAEKLEELLGTHPLVTSWVVLYPLLTPPAKKLVLLLLEHLLESGT